MANYRDRKLLDCAYNFPCMLQLPGCQGGDSGEPAHANSHRQGKGGAMKAHDCFHVPACRSCHVRIDSGSQMTREERQEAWEAAFWRYLPMLWQSGLIRVA